MYIDTQKHIDSLKVYLYENRNKYTTRELERAKNNLYELESLITFDE